MYDLVEVKMDQKSFEKIGRYKRSKFSSCLVYDPLTDKTSLKQQPKWVIYRVVCLDLANVILIYLSMFLCKICTLTIYIIKILDEGSDRT